ncbi:hypothetical protein HNQ93_001050 [Hymenobacter luteus]|uniref:Lipoprotein n=2 Tax=Hymenobacter TaxID=89966 RepID=A0A7W9WBA8_9BACT|nr:MULTISPECIES: hypothetical protein [Hymenobacter]MBB4599470.1 hypothetical protein [Hymenobacter latericoloratus]MBB6058220.1 hypothetical protein [Hymenobacter luteus]
MRSVFGWLLGTVVLLSACEPGQDATVRPNPANSKPAYFNLLGFLEKQATLLNGRKPVVEKQAVLRDGHQETTRVTQTDWAKELQIFQQADINKPALRGLYQVDCVTTPAGLVRRSYRRQPGTEHPVEQLTVVSRGGSVQELTATVAQDNPLVYSAKTMTLRCQNGQISSYQVSGVQKLVLFDSVRYAVRARVL